MDEIFQLNIIFINREQLHLSFDTEQNSDDHMFITTGNNTTTVRSSVFLVNVSLSIHCIGHITVNSWRSG